MVYVLAALAEVGVPEITHVAASIDNPAGSAGDIVQPVNVPDIRVGVMTAIAWFGASAYFVATKEIKGLVTES